MRWNWLFFTLCVSSSLFFTLWSEPLFTPNLIFISQMDTSLPSGSLPARYSAARISSFGWLSANQSLALLCFPLLIQCWDIPRKSATSSTHSLFQEVAEWGGYLALPLSRRPTGHHIFVIVTRYIHTPPLIQDFIFYVFQ